MEVIISVFFYILQTSVKMKLLCVQVIKDLLDQGIDVSINNKLCTIQQKVQNFEKMLIFCGIEE